MSEDVTIRVRDEGLEATTAKIKQLYQAAAAYESKGMDTAAGSARSEAKSLERDLARHAKEHANEQKAITREMREQEVVRKSRGGQGGMFSGVGGIGGIGGIAGLLGVGSVAAAAHQFASTIAREYMAALKGSAEIADQGIAGTNRTNLIRGIGGIRGEEMASAQFQGTRGELEALKTKRGTFGSMDVNMWDQFKAGVSDKWETTGQRAERENEEKIRKTETQLALDQKQAQQKYRDGVGGMDLAQQRAKVDGRYKEAVTIDMTTQALKRYNEVYEKSGDEGMAGESARLALKQKEIDVMRGLGGLAGARDGRGNLAALASLGQNFTAGESLQRFDKLIAVVEAGHKEQGVLKTHTK